MHITTSTSTGAIAPAATTDTGVAAAAATTPVADTTESTNERSGKSHGHRAHGGHGHLRQALNQALQNLGLTGAQDKQDGGGNVKHDMAQFMHALFQAVKGEPSSAPEAAGTTSADPKGSFAAGLSALITQAGSGTAPKALQDAFDKLAADFQSAAAPAAAPEPAATPDPSAPSTDPVAAPTSLPTTAGDADLAAPGTTAADAPSASSAASAVPSATPATAAPAATASALTLQALLTRLQQGMGDYGRRSAWTMPSTGNAVNLTA